MYATLAILEDSKHSGDLIGTHQKLDKAARLLLSKQLPLKSRQFPTIEEILYFEGMRGPDGLKRKSPGVDEPMQFIEPNHDNGVLVQQIFDHQYNLRRALQNNNRVRAAFEAAWLAHIVTDGLTPAHHYPHRKIVDELMADKDYKKLFGVKIKGIMRGDNLAQAIRNNWLYWGAGGVMTKHVAFEYGVAYTIAAIPIKRLLPKDFHRTELNQINLERAFRNSLDRIAALRMYDRFLQSGWNTQLVVETREILIREIVRTITVAWASCLLNEGEKPHAATKN